GIFLYSLRLGAFASLLRAGFLRVLGPERLNHRGIGFDVGPLDEIEAVRHGGEYSVQTLGDGRRFARQVDDERTAPNAGDLPGQDGRGHVLQRYRPHLLPEPVQDLVAYSLGRLRRDIPQGRPRASRGDHQTTPFLIAQLPERGLDLCLLIRHDARYRLPRRRQRLLQPLPDGGPTLILILPSAGPIGNRYDTDTYFLFRHCVIPAAGFIES